MAKGNYSGVFRPGGPVSDWSDWAMKQEQLNIASSERNQKTISDSEKIKDEKTEKLKAELDELGYGGSIEATRTGIGSTDQVIAESVLIAQDMLHDYNEKLKSLYLEHGGVNPFERAELMQRKKQIYDLPKNIALTQTRFTELGKSFYEKLSKGEVYETPENKMILEALNGGKFKAVPDKNNPSDLVIYFTDNEGNITEKMTMTDLNARGIGKVIPKLDMRTHGIEFGKKIGTQEKEYIDPKNPLYTRTEKGLKYDRKALNELFDGMSITNPEIADSFAYGIYGKDWDNLNDDQRETVKDVYSDYVILGVDEVDKLKFNSGLSSRDIALKNLEQRKKEHKEKEARMWANINKKDNDGKAMDYIVEEVLETTSNGNQVSVKVAIPTYNTKGLKVHVGTPNSKAGSKSVEINSIGVRPLSDGSMEIKGWDGTNSYILDEANLPRLKEYGITRESVIEEYEDLNNTNANSSSKSSGINW